jgi:hypothetical protein
LANVKLPDGLYRTKRSFARRGKGLHDIFLLIKALF